MSDVSTPFVFLPGSGGGSPDLSVLQTPGDDIHFETIDYPGWQRYVSNDFSAKTLIEELAEQIEARLPYGPIRIVGLSMGGHFGYALAIRLLAKGREIAGFCAIDSFMIDTAEPTEGWKARALAEALELLRTGRLGEFARFVRSRFWRALLRVAGDRLNKFCRSGWLPLLARFEPILERELSMRLLVREVAPWLASLDHQPVTLQAPAILLRTSLTAADDEAWHRRCPHMQTYELAGQHHTLFEGENALALREAFVNGTAAWCESAVL